MQKYDVKVFETAEEAYTATDRKIGFATTCFFKPGTNILHREDGPAVIYNDGSYRFFLEGESLYHINTVEKLLEEVNSRETPEVFNINLTQTEIDVLYTITCYVGGDPGVSPGRKEVKEIRKKLAGLRKRNDIEASGWLYF